MFRRGCVLLLIGLFAWVAPWSVEAEEATRRPGSFAGTDACIRCHKREAGPWAASPHARHAIPLATPEGGADGAVGSSWMQAYFRKDESGLHRIVSLCYDIREERWRPVTDVLEVIAGGGSATEPLTLADVAARSFDFDCSGCHASQTEFRVRGPDGHGGAHWREGSINCEACHGPGGEHTQAWGKLSSAAPLVRLERLSARAANAICTRCHGGPPAAGDFAPEDAQYHIALIHDRAAMFADGTASGQIYQDAGISTSPCVIEGGLRCTDCHESHRGGLVKQPHADALCTKCHDGYARRAHTHHDARKAGARCIECHMPKLLGGIMAHQRDHRIRSPLPASPHVPDACTACHKDKNKKWASEAYRKWWGKPSRADLSAIEAIALARKNDPGARPGLVRAFEHDNPYFRANAALFLSDPEPVLDDPSPEVRLVAVTAATHSSDPERFLLQLAQDKEPLVRAAAIRSLVRNGHGLRDEWIADLRLGLRHDRHQPMVALMLGLKAVEMEREEEARALLERAVVTLGLKAQANSHSLGLAWSGLASIAPNEKDKVDAHRQSAGYFRAHWRRDRGNAATLARAVRELVACNDGEAARQLIRDEIRLAANPRTRSALRELLVKLEENTK